MTTDHPRLLRADPQLYRVLREAVGGLLVLCGAGGLAVTAYLFAPLLGVAVGCALLIVAGLWLASSST